MNVLEQPKMTSKPSPISLLTPSRKLIYHFVWLALDFNIIKLSDLRNQQITPEHSMIPPMKTMKPMLLMMKTTLKMVMEMRTMVKTTIPKKMLKIPEMKKF